MLYDPESQIYDEQSYNIQLIFCLVLRSALACEKISHHLMFGEHEDHSIIEVVCTLPASLHTEPCP